MLGFNPDSAYGIGVSIARSETLLVITNLLGSCVFKTTFPSTNQLSALIERIQHGISESGLADQTISGLGISVPGTVTREGIVLHSGTLNWHHYNAGSVLQSQFPYPVFLGNDANCAALGERWLGAGKGTDDMLFLSIGNGVGGAVICNGKVVDGSHSLSGEICYQIGTDDIRQKRLMCWGKPVFLNRRFPHTPCQKHSGAVRRSLTPIAQGISWRVRPFLNLFWSSRLFWQISSDCSIPNG